MCALSGNVFGQSTLSNGKLVYNYPFAPSEGIVNRMEKEYRSEVCLNGFWDFQPVSLPSTYVKEKEWLLNYLYRKKNNGVILG